ncbi:MAG TPA: hypothetical protein VK614_08670 [Allosphingosinicella sp.]|nr:hypothetical protein [Allosphingosinicella sp.]
MKPPAAASRNIVLTATVRYAPARPIARAAMLVVASKSSCTGSQAAPGGPAIANASTAPSILLSRTRHDRDSVARPAAAMA